MALEFVGHVADLGGFAAAVGATAAAVRKIYRTLKQRLGRAPNVSRGAAAYLAAAHLVDQGVDKFDLMGSGDTNNAAIDGSYSGLDVFWVAFSRGRTIYMYTVTAAGDVKFMGTVERPGISGAHFRDE